ncbi:hypothetical protein [Mongoliimonas terrestris]|uniref:hypothetical protein n=1 Tax=Mongoliimonas terrestris TaxID=1709001 RepID=UPI00158807A0|nr:hypothetical protein [Mongoliimonas terrestris]
MSFLPIPDTALHGTSMVPGEDGERGADGTPEGRTPVAARPAETLSPALLAATLAVADAWREHLLPLLDSLDAIPLPLGMVNHPGDDVEDEDGDAGAEDGAGGIGDRDIADGDDADGGADLDGAEGEDAGGSDGRGWLPAHLASGPQAAHVRRIAELVDRARAVFDVDGDLVEFIGERPRLGVFRLYIRRRGFEAEIANTANLYDGMMKATIAEGAGPAQPISIAQALRIADRERLLP